MMHENHIGDGFLGLEAENKVDLCQEVKCHYNNKIHNLSTGKDTRGVQKLLLSTFIMNNDVLEAIKQLKDGFA